MGCLGSNEVFWPCGERGVWWAKWGCLGAKRGVWGRKMVFGGCNRKCSGGTLLVPGVPFQECK